MSVKMRAEVDYPSSDGKPMAETDMHRDWMVTIIQRLQRWYAGKRVYVSGNLLIYYVEGDAKKSFAPDAFVVKGCDPGKRRIFKIWEEVRIPNWVMETTSKKTRREDRGWKKELYAQLGIKEYFLYDPLGEWLKPSLMGFELVKGEYQPIEPNTDGSIVSKQLGIRFALEGRDLAMFDAETDERLLCAFEISQQAQLQAAESEQLALKERQRAQDAERRLAEVNAELLRLKKELGRKANGKPNGKA